MRRKQTIAKDINNFIDSKTSDMTNLQIAKRSGCSRKTIQRRKKKLLASGHISDWLEKIGLTDEYLARKLKDGLEATKVVGYLNNKIDGVQKTSDEFVEIPDFLTRHKYLVTALELKGYLNYNIKEAYANQNITIQIVKPADNSDTGGRIQI